MDTFTFLRSQRLFVPGIFCVIRQSVLPATWEKMLLSLCMGRLRSLPRITRISPPYKHSIWRRTVKAFERGERECSYRSLPRRSTVLLGILIAILRSDDLQEKVAFQLRKKIQNESVW